MKSILSTLSLVLLLSLTLNVNAQETTSEDPTPVDGTETTTDASGDASVSTDVDTTVDTTSDGTTDDTADTTSDGTTDDTADTTSDGTTDDTADTTSDGTTDDTADTTSDGTTDDTVDTTSDGTTDDTADTTSDGTTDDTADTTSDGTTDDTADTTSDGTTDDTADTTSDETTGDETSDEATDETTGDETSDEATDETTGDETSDEATDETTGDETSDEATDETTGDETSDEATDEATGDETSDEATDEATGDETSDEATDEATGDETSDETADESNGEITLEFIVEGFVYDESDQALPDVEVTLGELSATSNEEGYYQIVGLTAGTYTLAGEKTDYVFENQQLTLDDENPVVAVNLRSIAGGKIEGSQLIVVGAYVCESNNTVSFATGSGDSLYQFDPEFSSKGVVLSSADFNSDDSTDVAVGAKDEGNDVYLFDAKGERFVTIITNSNEEGANTQFGDFDGDGVLEIVVAEQSPGSRLYLYESTGEAIRALPIFDDETAFNFALGDVNNDGSDEIVVTLATTSEGEDNVYIYQNDGTLLGSFKALAMGDTAPGLVVSVSNVEGDDSAEIVVGIAEDDMDYKVGVYTYGGDLLNDFTVFASLSSDDETVSSNRVTRDDDDGRSDDDDDDDNDGRSDDDDDDDDNDGRSDDDDDDDDNDGRSDDDDDDDDNDSRSDDDDDDDDNDSRSDDDDDNDDQGESSDDERVSICHKGRKTITVAASAVPAHLAHGDSRGACGSNDGNTDEDDGRDDDNIVTACTLSSLEGLLLTTGDLDGDGFAEIIVGKAGAQEVRVYTPAGELSERFNAVENTATLTALSYGEKMAVELPVVSELPEDPEAPLEDITVIGEEDAPVIIEDREIQGTVRVAHAIIVNIRISVGARLVVGPGVKFRTPNAIPVGLNLTSVFPKINMSARVQSFTTTFEAVDLSSTSVVEDAPPVLDDIQVILEDDEIEQNPENGNLEVDQGDTRYTVAPVSVEQAAEDEAPGVSIEDDGSVVFITLRGQKVKAQPVPQEPTSFVTALSQFSFSQLKMSVTGQLNVLENTDLGRRTGRADLFSNLVVTTGVSLGGFAIESSYISNRTVSGYRFLDEQGRMWQQLIYPTAAYPEMLFDLSDGESNASDVELYQDGIIFFSLGANTHTGVLGYEILSGSTSVSTGVEFSFMSDMNADGIEDAMITYPTGETQVIYLLD